LALATHLAVRPRSLPVAALLALALLGAVLSTAIASVVAPNDVFGLSVPKVTACAGVNVRTSPSTPAPIRATLGSGAKVTVALTVKGARWTVSCGGATSTSTSWYRISAIDGVSVASHYGVAYLYAAAGLFKPASTADTPAATLISTNAAICSANARTGPSTSRPNKVTLHAGTKVTVTTKVIGGVWRLSCGSRHMSSTWWYRISAINGRSVKSLYRVTYLYAAIGLFKTLPKPIVVPPKPPANGLTEGIDISHWQGTIDWGKVAAAGKKFAFMKASEDIDYVDPTYQANRAAANANGLLIGAYHFAQPDLTPGDAIAEADHFLDTAQIASGDLLPVLDLEVAGPSGATLTQGQLQDWVRAYLGRIYERTGIRGVIYMSPAFWVKYAGDSTWFANSGYKVLWIAHWTTATVPTVPADAWGGNGWSFWQYTSSGSVSGITGRVDLDRFNGTDFTRVRIP
jgi:GH25 family lysozyme M1 (1,4-beta-N-acetylmuramidase)